MKLVTNSCSNGRNDENGFAHVAMKTDVGEIQLARLITNKKAILAAASEIRIFSFREFALNKRQRGV